MAAHPVAPDLEFDAVFHAQLELPLIVLAVFRVSSSDPLPALRLSAERSLPSVLLSGMAGRSAFVLVAVCQAIGLLGKRCSQQARRLVARIRRETRYFSIALYVRRIQRSNQARPLLFMIARNMGQ